MTQDEYQNIYDNENSYWWYRILDDLIEYFIRIYKDAHSIKILDAGCGTGRVITKLSKFGEVYGIDASPIAVELCKSRGLTNVEQVDLNNWSSERKFNVIVSLDVLYHKSLKDVEKILSAFSDALLPNGILILNLPAFDLLKRDHDQVVGGDKRFKKNELRNKLTKNGFDIYTISYRHPLLFKVIVLRKLFSTKNSAPTSDLTPLSPFVNSSLDLIHQFENEIIKLGFSIPYGSSVFTVAKKKSPADSNVLFPDKYVNNDLLFKIKSYLKSGVLLDQFFKYSIVGVLNTLIGLTVIFLLYNVLHINYLLSNIGGYFVGLVNSFLWNRNWTFNSQKHFSKEVLPFLMVFGFSFVLNLLVVLLSVEVFKIRPNFAQILGIAVYSITNFLINKNWTFSK